MSVIVKAISELVDGNCLVVGEGKMVKTDVYGLCFSEKWSVICYIARKIE